MEFIELVVRIHLDRLRVDRTDDGFVAGSADEPYLWVIVAKIDGSTISESSPQTATVAVLTTSAAPGNLGTASQGVAAGHWIPVPSSVGTLTTTLRGATGPGLMLTRFATLVVAVAALEHDESRTQDILALHQRIIDESKSSLEAELRKIVQEVLAGNIPSAADVRERLESQISEESLEAIIDDFGSDLVGQPVNLLNQDVFVGHNVDTVLTFPDLLASAMDGISIKLRSDTWGELFDRKFSTGAGVACSADGRLVYIMATGEDGNVYATLDLNGGGSWEVDWFPIGIRSVASPALACSADGHKLFLITLGEDRKLYESIFDVGPEKLAPKITLPLDSLLFKSAPACACSDDGKRLWFAAMGDDGRMRVSKPKLEAGSSSIWTDLGELVSAPALACSPDGQTIHIAAIDKALRLRHRFSTDGGASWPKRDGQNWEVLQENAAWF